MIKATEARKMVERAVEEAEKRAMEKAERFCNELSQEIEEHSMNKVTGFIFPIPNGIRRACVISILQDNGYFVSALADGRVQIAW